MKEDFLNKISDTIRIFSSSLDEEKEGMKLNIQNVQTEGTGFSKSFVRSLDPCRSVRTARVRASREPIKSKIVNGKSCWIIYNRIGVSQKKYFKRDWRCCQYKNQWIKCNFETLGRGKTSFILEGWKHHIIQTGISHQIPILSQDSWLFYIQPSKIKAV